MRQKKFQLGVTEDGRVIKNCRTCEGTGIIYEQTGRITSKRYKCPRCKGTGLILKVA